MFAVTAARFSPDDPLSALELGEHDEPRPPEGWTTVTVKAASLNHHDVWTLRGVGISADRLPMILGCDAAGVDADGREVVVHGVVSDPGSAPGDETLDPARSLLSERYDGTFAERVTVPRRNLIPKPAGLSFEDAVVSAAALGATVAAVASAQARPPSSHERVLCRPFQHLTTAAGRGPRYVVRNDTFGHRSECLVNVDDLPDFRISKSGAHGNPAE